MNRVFITAGLLLVLSLASCNQKAGQQPETSTPAKEEPKKPEITVSQLASNKDFVCGMEVADGGIADTASYEGKIYGFCSAECKAEFVKNPSSYLAQK